MSGRALSRIAFFVFASTLLLHAQAGQQPPRPADERIGNRLGALTPADPAAIERGRTLYLSGCAFCHGADARGAQGPDLARSLFVTNDVGGRVLGEFLKTGRPANGMPPFPTLTASDLTDLSAFLRTRVTAAMSRPPMDPRVDCRGECHRRRCLFQWSRPLLDLPFTERRLQG